MFETMEMDWKFWILTIAVLLGMIHVAFSELKKIFNSEEEREEDDRYDGGEGSYYK